MKRLTAPLRTILLAWFRCRHCELCYGIEVGAPEADCPRCGEPAFRRRPA